MMKIKNLFKYAAFTLFIAGVSSCSTDKSSKEKAENEQKANSDNIRQAVPVEVMVIKEKVLERTLSLTGALKPVHAVDIVSEASGKVIKINKKLGSRVNPDDILAVIDYKIPYSRYEQAKAQVLMAENNLKIAQLNLQSDKELYENNDISELEYQNSNLAVKTAEANLLSAKANLSLTEKEYQDTRITSPFSGFISREYIELGMMVNPNTPLYQVVDLKELKISLGIPQDVIQSVNRSSRASVTISALDNETFPADVRFVSPHADPATGAFETEIYVINTADRRIKGGMTARVNLTLDDIGRQTAAPDYAVIPKNDHHIVYKYQNGTAKMTDVKTGPAFGNNIVIREGVVPGDTIVVTGMKNLGVETSVIIEKIEE